MTSDFEIKISSFQGPLDLLLELVREKKVDLLSINLVELATAYMEVLEVLKEKRFDLASEYLVVAATLLRIKAKAFLNEGDDNEVIVEEENLLTRLIIYQKFKNIAGILKEKAIHRKTIFIKKETAYESFGFKHYYDITKLDGHSSVASLMTTLRLMFERIYARNLRETTIERINLSPIERRQEILALFKDVTDPTFRDIFKVPTLAHFAVTWVTVLDMARRQEILLKQKDQFANIKIEKRRNYEF